MPKVMRYQVLLEGTVIMDKGRTRDDLNKLLMSFVDNLKMPVREFSDPEATVTVFPKEE